jgi:hypothetical protein
LDAGPRDARGDFMGRIRIKVPDDDVIGFGEPLGAGAAQAAATARNEDDRFLTHYPIQNRLEAGEGNSSHPLRLYAGTFINDRQNWVNSTSTFNLRGKIHINVRLGRIVWYANKRAGHFEILIVAG